MNKKGIILIGKIAIGLLLTIALTGCALLKPKPDENFTYNAGSLRNVMRVSDDGIDKGWLAVSKDGQQLLYCEQPADFDPGSNTVYRSSEIIYLRNAMVFAKTPLVGSFNYAPAWYENGNNFVYITQNQNGTTQLVKSSISGGRTFVTRNPIGSGHGDNNPSVRGDIIACDVYINGQRQIVTLRDNGTELTVLGRGSQPSWHPTENKLVFTRDNGIWEMDIETTQVTALHTISPAEARAGVYAGKPSYTSDGRHIVFVKNVPVEKNNWRHLYAMSSTGTNVTELTGGRVNIWSPAVGAGNEIFFISNAGGKTEIWSALVSLD